ncbi:DUF4406 domain-containing protein [Pseudomonas nitroreducens]|uniref:DUF4406 domain-containing protein n=1 Tax=Pseudomonas nitroreducens TaxID=46680 RepID=UPI0026589857|nr:DUF4406 domain-containing protein [Pseudomonas nitroreducens]MCP1651552.1 hypothetical protein [Pseudomonas nitroreducens]MCP1684582.1 hypothetical protein [Pseudomonas nitroreducens]
MKLTSIPRIKRVSLDRPRLRQFGYHVENPADQGLIDGFEWADYLRLDLTKLITCQAIALLPGWDKSKGARPEYHVASELGMQVFTAPTSKERRMNEFIVISVKHTKRRHKAITLWRPDDRGYCWTLERAGRYAEARVLEHLSYYNSGCTNIAVPLTLVEQLAGEVE